MKVAALAAAALSPVRRRTSVVGVCVVIAAAVLGAVTLTGCGGSSSAFSASKLASAASKEWLTNGGSALVSTGSVAPSDSH